MTFTTDVLHVGGAAAVMSAGLLTPAVAAFFAINAYATATLCMAPQGPFVEYGLERATVVN